MSQEAQSRLPEWVSKPAVRIAAGALALGAPLAACGGDDTGDSETGFTPNPAHTLTVEPTATNTPFTVESTPTSTPTATPEPTMTPTPTPEAVLEVPCKVLPEEFCKGGKLLETTVNGVAQTYIGLNVPAGTPIYALTSGQLAKTQESGQFFSGFGGQIINPEQTGASLIKGDIVYETMVYETVEEGQQIAVVGDRGIENLGGYNFIFTVNKRTSNGPVPNVDLLKQYFPDAFDQAPTKASNPVGTPSNNPSNYIYVPSIVTPLPTPLPPR